MRASSRWMPAGESRRSSLIASRDGQPSGSLVRTAIRTRSVSGSKPSAFEPSASRQARIIAVIFGSRRGMGCFSTSGRNTSALAGWEKQAGAPKAASCCSASSGLGCSK